MRVVSVREARPVEFDTLARLTVAAFRGVSGAALPDEYAAELADVVARSRDACLLVGEVDGELVGSVAYVPDSRSSMAEGLAPGEAGIRMLAVAPEAQGAGVGAALVSACVERARSEGRTGVALYTMELMHAAHRLYVRAGFVRVPERDWELERGFVLLSLVKRLD